MRCMSSSPLSSLRNTVPPAAGFRADRVLRWVRGEKPDGRRPPPTRSCTASLLGVPPEETYGRVQSLVDQLQEKDKQLKQMQRKLARVEFEAMLSQAHEISGVQVISLKVDVPDVSMLREMSDWFRDKLGSGVVVLGTVTNDKPLVIATVTDDLVKRGLHAGKLVKEVAQVMGGGGGGKPTMAQAGGKDVAKLDEALAKVDGLVSEAIG